MALDTPLYEVCRGCGGALKGLSSMMDGLCDAPAKLDERDVSCYAKMAEWLYKNKEDGVLAAVLIQDADLVLIDEWLESRTP
jgi:hypothetical protein